MNAIESTRLLLLIGLLPAACTHPQVSGPHQQVVQAEVEAARPQPLVMRPHVVRDTPLLGLTEAEAIALAQPRDVIRKPDGSIWLFEGQVFGIEETGVPLEIWLRLKFADGRITEVQSVARPRTGEPLH